MNFARALWWEPRPPQPRGGVPWFDKVLVALLAPLAVVEGVVREVPWRAAAVVACVAVVALLLGRRRHSFAVFCAAFAVVSVLDVAAFVAGVERHDGLYVNAAILLLPYSLFRWGAGREAAIGLVVLALVYASSWTTGGMKDAGEAVGAAVVMLLPAAIGASVRFWSKAQERELENVRAHERERLARDLHDTVAHHVSAMVIQAQAGRILVEKRPDAAERALATIEAEGVRALAELRTLVGVLRAGDDAPLAPQRGFVDVDALARAADAADGRVVDVVRSGDLDDVGAAVEAAVFRIAQEAVTNALRHARAATRVSVRVEGNDDGVRVCVDDDGAAPTKTEPTQQKKTGYGLAGMAERAALLGGTFTAGPRAEGGWRVDVFLPKKKKEAA